MKSNLRFFVAPFRIAIAACAAALLGACATDTPPDGYTAVAPADSPPGANTCPDLRGTFDLAGTALGKAIARRQPPQTHDLPVLLTFKPGASNIEGWWVVPRERLFAFAKDQSQDAPRRYATWRGLVLKEHLSEKMRYDVDAYLATIAEVGPPGPTYAMVVGQRCAQNWMLVYNEHEQAATNDGAPREIEREIWLARDAKGALLARWVTYNLMSYSMWAPATQYVRTSSSTDYQRYDLEAPESAEALAAAELPPDPATVQPKPMACAEVPARVDAFSQRLNALVRKPTTVTRFSLNPVRQQDTDGHCPFAVIDVEISGGDAHFLGRTEEWVRKEPNVDSVETLRLGAGQNRSSTRRFRVVLR